MRERMVSSWRSGALDKKLDINEAVGSAWAAKRTVWRSSRFAMRETVESWEASILTACTMV